MITGIVLCGGRSTRMGEDKALLLFDGETMLARVVRLVGEVADDVIVVTRPGNTFAPPGGGHPFRQLPVRIVHDPVEHLGPLAGIAAGLAASTSDTNLVVACDMPLVKPAVLRRLVELRDGADACVAVVDGFASPLCAVYGPHVAAAARDLLAAGERRAMALLDRVQTKRVEGALFRDLDPNLDSFVSCDTPETYAALLARRAEL